MKKLDALLTNSQEIIPSDRIIIEGLRDGGTTLNEDILSRIYINSRNDAQAIYRVASDAGRMCAEQKKSNSLENFSECFKKIAAVVMSKP